MLVEVKSGNSLKNELNIFNFLNLWRYPVQENILPRKFFILGQDNVKYENSM